MNDTGIYPKNRLSTAQIKKEYEREFNHAKQYTEDVLTKFELTLFNGPESLSYADIYMHFSKEWYRMLNALRKKRFKHLVIDKDHFEKLYAPNLID